MSAAILCEHGFTAGNCTEEGCLYRREVKNATSVERELESLRRFYGVKFDAIAHALGLLSGLRDALEIEDLEAANYRLSQVEEVLRDA